MKSSSKGRMIGALGLTTDELRLLGSIACLTGSRPGGGYHIATDVRDADICIVNADDYSAMSKWRYLSVGANPPVMVLYTGTKPVDPSQDYILRPFGPSRLLALLDKISTKIRESAEVWKIPVESKQLQACAGAPQTRALVIDDSLTVLKQLSIELQKLNIQADCAETGESGLNMLLYSQYDIIFLDIVLPGTDGYQICKSIRKNPKTRLTPVVLLSSKSSAFDRVRGKLAGCNEYLTKPVDYKAFRSVVDKYVKTDVPVDFLL